jgi:transposase
MASGYESKQYVGIDLHRRRSMIVRQDASGEVLEQVRIDNDPVVLACALEQAGPDPEVVLEATYGWYWAADVLQASGARVHLAHPLGVKGWSYRRVKNDELDAGGLADLLRMGRLPEAWLAPPAVRQLRELVRHRAKCVALRSGLKAQVHAVLAKEGVAVPMSDLFGRAGMALLADVPLARAYRMRVTSLLELIDAFDQAVETFRRLIAEELAEHAGYRAVQTIPGVGETFAAIFVAEIGDVRRFPAPAQLCSWAGLTPKHQESDATVRRGHITQQGNRLVRWAAVEAVQKLPVDAKLRGDRDRIAGRRGKNIGKVAAARKLLTLVYYGLRDGHIRCLAKAAARDGSDAAGARARRMS